MVCGGNCPRYCKIYHDDSPNIKVGYLMGICSTKQFKKQMLSLHRGNELWWSIRDAFMNEHGFSNYNREAHDRFKTYIESLGGQSDYYGDLIFNDEADIIMLMLKFGGQE